MTFDEQLDSFQRSFVVARRNPWHGGDLLDEEFRPFLMSLGSAPGRDANRADTTTRTNPWREAAGSRV
ncbi:MAG: hypothetical protein JJU45_01965 [Acidimicrobiia bacterium]|nr:hypothetical protein [Acidimicrobiia bacterium]